MDMVSSVILGAVQGLTEFIPVSSSGHLILARDIFSISTENALSFDAILQLATSLAVLVYFRKDVLRLVKTFISFFVKPKERSTPMDERKDKTLFVALILGTIPAVIGGLLLESYMETVFRNAHFVAWVLIIGSGIFLLAERVSKKDGILSLGRGFTAGLFQTLALFPGMSRSGITISGGLFAGLSREEAVRFSFLLSLPILLGSGFKKLLEIGGVGEMNLALITGSIVAFFVGLGAIHFLVSFLKKHTLLAFVIYRVVLAILILVFI